MKRLTFFLLLFGTTTYSQSLKEKLQGDWVCIEILDTNGNITSGKFSNSNEYLKFSFVKGDLSITEAPFDMGIKMPIKYGDDYIDLFPEAVYNVPERKYSIGSINNDSLILLTYNENGEKIFYHLINQAKLLKEVSTDKRVIDEGLIIIKCIKSSKNSNEGNNTSEYRISNDSENLYPGPIFNDNTFAAFGEYFTNNFVFPKTYPLDSVSNELIVDFDVTDKGVQNIKLIQGLNDEINATVIKLIEKTNKKWKPLEINKSSINATLRFHFIFYLTFAESRIKFENSTRTIRFN